AMELEHLSETRDHLRQIRERVVELLTRRQIGLAEARQVRRDHSVAVGQFWNQIAKHVTRGREAVQQQQHWCVRGASLAIGYAEAIDIDPVVANGAHLSFPCEEESL